MAVEGLAIRASPTAWRSNSTLMPTPTTLSFPRPTNSGNTPANHIAIQSCGASANTADHTTCELSIATPNCEHGRRTAAQRAVEYHHQRAHRRKAVKGLVRASFIQVTIGGPAMFEGQLACRVDLSSLLHSQTLATMAPSIAHTWVSLAATGAFFGGKRHFQLDFTLAYRTDHHADQFAAGHFTPLHLRQLSLQGEARCWHRDAVGDGSAN